jgi:hypothetical protein
MCICWSDNYYPLMFKDRQVKSTISSIEYFSKLGLILTSICIKIFCWFDYSLNMIVDRSCKYSKQFWFKFIIIISAQTIKEIYSENYTYREWINYIRTYLWTNYKYLCSLLECRYVLSCITSVKNNP